MDPNAQQLNIIRGMISATPWSLKVIWTIFTVLQSTSSYIILYHNFMSKKSFTNCQNNIKYLLSQRMGNESSKQDHFQIPQYDEGGSLEIKSFSYLSHYCEYSNLSLKQFKVNSWVWYNKAFVGLGRCYNVQTER